MTSFDDILEIEDSLQEFEVFTNGFSGKPCHSDSYMTLVDFNKLDRALDHIMAKFPERMQDCVEYWTTSQNMQPPLRLVGLTLKRRLNK